MRMTNTVSCGHQGKSTARKESQRWEAALLCSHTGEVQQNDACETEVIASRWGRTFLKGEAIRCQSNLDKIQVVMDALLTII